MQVRVTRAFALGSRIYSPGIYELTEELADDVAQLEREGWIVVVCDDDPIRLNSPERGQSLVLRQ